jgi:septal ring factor EnvC (AmiA/AmiB activator)
LLGKLDLARVRVRGLFALVAALWFGSTLAQVADPLSEENQKLDRVRDHIKELMRRMDSVKGERGELTRRLQQSEQEIGALTRRLRVLAGQLQRQRKQLAELRHEEDSALARLELQRDALARQIRAAYVIGRQERLQLLLNQQDATKLNRVLTYYDYVNRARVQRMTLIRERLNELASIRTDITREEERLNGLLDKQRNELTALEQNRAGRLEVIRALGAQLEDQGQQLDRLRNNERQLQVLIKDIEQALMDIPAEVPGQQRFSERKGRLAWPAAGRLGARFGTKKVGSLRWDGVLIQTTEGREVKAVHHGRVAFADWLRGFGLLLIVDHGDGWMTLYGHNQSLFKEVGEWVQTDEPVALVGNSGGRRDAGVYFGIRHKGVAVDPLRWCRRPRGERVG